MNSNALKILVLTIATCAAAECRAQYNPFILDAKAPDTRARRTEFYLLGEYWHSEDITMHNVTLPTAIGPNPPLATSDLRMKFDDAGMLGFGVMYNINNHFAIDGDHLRRSTEPGGDVARHEEAFLVTDAGAARPSELEGRLDIDGRSEEVA